jgi:hypothetical protein
MASETSTAATPTENVANAARSAYQRELERTGDPGAAAQAARKAAASTRTS